MFSESVKGKHFNALEITAGMPFSVPCDGFAVLHASIVATGYYAWYVTNGRGYNFAFSGNSSTNFQITHVFPVRKGDYLENAAFENLFAATLAFIPIEE